MMELISLGKLCHKITDGSHNPPKGLEFGGLMLSSRNITNNGLTLDHARFLDKEDFERENKRTDVCPGDVLMTIVGTLGRVLVVNKQHPKFTLQRSVGVLKPNLEILFPIYLAYALKSETFQRKLTKGAKGVAQKGIYLKEIRNLKIPLPPLDQQKKIAAILDAADTCRQKTKALIEKYEELTQSLFLDMFGDPVTNSKGWEEIKLGNICGVGSSKRVFVNELVEDGIPFYRGTEVGKLGEGKSIIPKLFITKEHYERLKEHRGIPKKGDLLMPSICPDGRIWVVDDDKEFYFKDGRVLWVEVDSRKINSIYLRYHMKGSFFANYNNIASGTTFAELKIVALKKMNIFYPDLNLQNQFAEKVQAIEAQKEQAQASLAGAEDLFNSLLQRAFKGELV